MRLIALALVVAAAAGRGDPLGELTIAAAANLTDVFRQIGPRFQAATGIRPVFSFGSTAQLTQQIEHSAPYDLFAAADSEHVDQLDRERLLLAGTRSVYATGILALWVPPQSKASISRIEDLTSPAVRVIAVAKPELAPYGQATVDTLRHLGIWDKVKSKIVYADSISMAKQYGASGNADAVFTAYSLVLKESGRTLRVDDGLHQPIRQSLGIMAASSNHPQARRFVAFLLTGEGRQILASHGYRVPPIAGQGGTK
jgi:molybdate transport system substrate-binding protein